MDARFRRDHRLNLKSDFTRVFKRSHRSADRLFVVLARNGASGSPRLGMAISLKATGRAVSRNRIKRLVRESFRQHRSHLPPLDFVVMARPGVSREPSARIAESLQAHWNRIAKQCAEL
ncbi:MAG: ribonuclease P protein component [Gammaproteobacteria bacterium]|jgi:ribonuclease P protein component